MNNKIVASSLLLAIGLIVSAGIIAKTLIDIRSLDNIISVSGSAKIEVVSDSAIWRGSFSRNAFQDQLKDGYAKIKSDEQIVSQFLADQGIKAENIEISPVFVNEVYKYNADYSGPTEYNLVQSITVKSDTPQSMEKLAKNVEILAQKGVIFSPNAIEYYYSGLPELRISLLPDAIKDAKARAEAIASSSGQKVGLVKSVSMGVVQVMPKGSVDISDYGMYDTSSIDKDVMITVKASFSLE